MQSETAIDEAVCECCGEQAVWGIARGHGYEYCEFCAHDVTCDECDTQIAQDAAECPYIWETALCEACAERQARQVHMERVTDALYDAGLIPVGASNASEAEYWGLGRGGRQIRVAGHDPVWQSSCECYCIGLSPGLDADVIAEEGISDAELRAIAEVAARWAGVGEDEDEDQQSELSAEADA